MLCEQNFRPLTNLIESGYSVQVEVGDLAQNSHVWPDQVIRVTVRAPDGDVKSSLFRGSRSRIDAGKWLRDVTSDAIISV